MSDCGPQFVSKMWDSLCKLLEITAKLFTTFHPETNNQSKNANQKAEQQLQSYVNYFQDDWVRLLPMGEFSANTNVSATTKVPPFLATKSCNPRMSFNPMDLLANLTREKIANSTAKSIANRMEKVWEFMQDKMTKSQVKQVVAANYHRKEPPVYKVEDKVFLSTRNIKTKQLLKKLNHKNIGPLKIKKLVGLLYQLELPYTMKIHDVFHSNLLWKAADDPLPSQQNSPPPPVVVNDEEEWEVNNILNTKRGKSGKKVLFWVKWKGYDDNKAWYNVINFNHIQDIVDDFYKQNPTKPQWGNNLLTWWLTKSIPLMEINQTDDVTWTRVLYAQGCHVHKRWWIFKKDKMKFLRLADKYIIFNREISECLTALRTGITFSWSGNLQVWKGDSVTSLKSAILSLGSRLADQASGCLLTLLASIASHCYQVWLTTSAALVTWPLTKAIFIFQSSSFLLFLSLYLGTL